MCIQTTYPVMRLFGVRPMIHHSLSSPPRTQLTACQVSATERLLPDEGLASSLFTLLTALPLHLCHFRLFIYSVDVLHLVSGINSRFLFDNLILVFLFPAHDFLRLPLCLRPSIHHSIIHNSVTDSLSTYLFRKSFSPYNTLFLSLN